MAGIEVLGRWAGFVFPLIIGVVFVMTLLLTKRMNFLNILPFLSDGLNPILKNAFSAFAFPFAETVAFLMVLDNLKDAKSIFKTFLIGLLIGGALILLVSMRNILVLGVDLATHLYFPSYSAGRLISMGDFLQRIEVIFAIVYLLAGTIKISICLYGACKGLAKVFNFPSYQSIVVPIGLLMIDFAILVFNNVIEMFEWADKIYPFYALPFQVILPIIIFGAAKIKLRSNPSNVQT